MHAESLNAAYTRPEQDVFLTMDPNYEIRGSFMPGDVLEIRGRLTLMSEEMLVEAAEPLWKKDETWFTKVRRKIRG